MLQSKRLLGAIIFAFLFSFVSIPKSNATAPPDEPSSPRSCENFFAILKGRPLTLPVYRPAADLDHAYLFDQLRAEPLLTAHARTALLLRTYIDQRLNQLPADLQAQMREQFAERVTYNIEQPEHDEFGRPHTNDYRWDGGPIPGMEAEQQKASFGQMGKFVIFDILEWKSIPLLHYAELIYRLEFAIQEVHSVKRDKWAETADFLANFQSKRLANRRFRTMMARAVAAQYHAINLIPAEDLLSQLSEVSRLHFRDDFFNWYTDVFIDQVNLAGYGDLDAMVEHRWQTGHERSLYKRDRFAALGLTGLIGLPFAEIILQQMF